MLLALKNMWRVMSQPVYQNKRLIISFNLLMSEVDLFGCLC